jgi:hypothetical protein
MKNLIDHEWRHALYDVVSLLQQLLTDGMAVHDDLQEIYSSRVLRQAGQRDAVAAFADRMLSNQYGQAAAADQL